MPIERRSEFALRQIESPDHFGCGGCVFLELEPSDSGFCSANRSENPDYNCGNKAYSVVKLVHVLTDIEYDPAYLVSLYRGGAHGTN